MASLRHVLWIGGPAGAGKTTIATRLARRHGLRWYNADTQTWAHRDRAIAAGSPAAIRWEAMSPEERRLKPRRRRSSSFPSTANEARWSSMTCASCPSRR